MMSMKEFMTEIIPQLTAFADVGEYPVSVTPSLNIQKKIQRKFKIVFFCEMIDELKLSSITSTERVENVDIPIFDSPDR